jgi:hypothetical protein
VAEALARRDVAVLSTILRQPGRGFTLEYSELGGRLNLIGDCDRTRIAARYPVPVEIREFLRLPIAQ